jgi:hypothetical protein
MLKIYSGCQKFFDFDVGAQLAVPQPLMGLASTPLQKEIISGNGNKIAARLVSSDAYSSQDGRMISVKFTCTMMGGRDGAFGGFDNQKKYSRLQI